MLLYTHHWAPSVGGVETITTTLAQGLATRMEAVGEDKINLTLVTQTPAGDMDDSLLPFRVVRRPKLGHLIRLVRSSDLIQAAGPALLPLVLGFLLRKPTVIEHHGFQAVCPNGQLHFQPTQQPCPGHFMAGRYQKCLSCNRKSVGLAKSFRMLLSTPVRRWLSNRAATNVMPTDWLASSLKSVRMKTIHHGITLSSALVTPANTSVVTFAFQGRLVTTKGVRVLLEAVGQLHQEGRDVL